MDSIITILLQQIVAGGPAVLAVLGWGLYFMERYYVTPRREKEHREALKTFKEEYKEIAEKTTETIAHFTTLLEVIKDRMGRNT